MGDHGDEELTVQVVQAVHDAHELRGKGSQSSCDHSVAIVGTDARA